MTATNVEMGLITLAVGLVLLAGGVWIPLALAGSALVALAVFTSVPLVKVIGTSLWGASASWTLAALPLYIWMGEILFRTRLSQDLFHAIAPWVGRLPGRLLHANVIGCGIFAAVSGSSAATAATIGSISLPELRKRGYDEAMSLGSLAGSGTLGLLIPPSIVMIVYGVTAEVSIIRLFIAGIVPGLLLIVMFSGYIGAWALMHPAKMPPADEPVPWPDRLRQTWRVMPVVVLIGSVIGSIYLSIATPTEAAALGIVGALAISAWSGSLTMDNFRASLVGATQLSGMIGFILACSALLTTAMSYTGVPDGMATWVTSLDLPPYALIAAFCALYILLGCVIDGLSMIVLTTSVILPSVQAAGFDLLWFGIFVVLVVEMAQITPPVGFNLFVIQALTEKSVVTIARYSLPFFFLLIGAVALITVFPQIVLWLPARIMQ